MRTRSPSLYYESRYKHCHDFPWKEQIDYHAGALQCRGRVIRPSLHVRLEKGFTLEQVKDASPPDTYWTSYRRNYFSIQVSTMFDAEDIRMPIEYRSRPVKAFGYRLTAATFSRNTEKNAELVQYGPKREKEGLGKPEIKRLLLPTSMAGRSRAPLESAFRPVNAGTARPFIETDTLDEALSYDNTFHTFERIQFKKATANNGRRRAQQQFYHLKVELLADISDAGPTAPNWQPITIRVSEGIIVRGRSPSHYKSDTDGQDEVDDPASPDMRAQSPTPNFLPRAQSSLYSSSRRPLPPLDAPGSNIVNPTAYHYHRPLGSTEHYTHATAHSVSSTASTVPSLPRGAAVAVDDPFDRTNNTSIAAATLDPWRRDPVTSTGYSYSPSPLYKPGRDLGAYGGVSASAGVSMGTSAGVGAGAGGVVESELSSPPPLSHHSEYRTAVAAAPPTLPWDTGYADDYAAGAGSGLYARDLPSVFPSPSSS